MKELGRHWRKYKRILRSSSGYSCARWAWIKTFVPSCHQTIESTSRNLASSTRENFVVVQTFEEPCKGISTDRPPCSQRQRKLLSRMQNSANSFVSKLR